MNWGGTGGFPAYTDPVPAPAAWNIAAVLVTTREGDFGADLDAERATWKDRLVGSGFSVKNYYEEVSYYDGGSHGTTVRLLGDRVLGPVVLDAGWGEVFTPNDPGDTAAGWLTTPGGRKILADGVSSWLADQADGYDIARRADAVVFLVRPASTVPVPAGAETTCPPSTSTRTRAAPSSGGRIRRRPRSPRGSGRSSPPPPRTRRHSDCRPASRPGRCVTRSATRSAWTICTTPTATTPPRSSRARSWGATSWTTTSRARTSAWPTGSRLGWFPSAWLRRFDFTADPHGDTVELQAVETLDAGGPTAGRSGAVEVAVQDGWSYLFEYRAEQPGQIGDQHLHSLGPGGQKQLVLGTDVRVPRGQVPDGAARPPILQLPVDGDGDGPGSTRGTTTRTAT